MMKPSEQAAELAKLQSERHGFGEGSGGRVSALESDSDANEGIHSILNKIQVGLLAKKNQRNTFGNYNYRSCEDILEALKPHLDKHKCTLILNDELVLVGDRYYIKATASLRNSANPNVLRMEATAYARESEIKKGMDAAQITGAASSYARKYALNGLFSIDDTKDPDATNNSNDEELDALVSEIKEAEQKGRWDILSLLSRQEVWANAWGMLDTHTKGKINKLTDIFSSYRDKLNNLAEQGDENGVSQLWYELTKEEKAALGTTLVSNTQAVITEIVKQKREESENPDKSAYEEARPDPSDGDNIP